MKYKNLNKKELEKGLKDSLESYKDKKVFRPLSENIKKYRFIGFDVETYSKKNLFYLGGIIDYNGEYKDFYDVGELKKYFNRIKHNDVIVVTTNLAFDYMVTFNDKEYVNKTNFIINKGRFICCTLDGSYNKTRFVDTLNYGGLSVEKMGLILGKEKLKKPVCLGKKPRDREELEELKIYNKRDIEITLEFIEMFQRVVNDIGGELKLTISSTAMDIFSRRFLQEDIVREDLRLGFRVKDKIFKAYYGGRTEVFKRGLIKDYFYFDINSLYPWVMLREFPDPNTVFYKYDSSVEDLEFEGVSFFELDIPYSEYPVLPFRNKDKKLLFPYGKIDGYYSHVEMRYAVEVYGLGIIRSMKDSVLYKGTKKFFEEYITFMYSERLKAKEDDSPMETVYKLLMNSLYGRFALKSVSKTNFFIADSDETVLSKIKEAGKSATLKINRNEMSYYSFEEDYEGRSSFPIWSVYISSYSRIEIHKLISKYKAVYCDTDSLFTKQDIPCSKELGGLKLEEYIDEGLIIKPKIYFTKKYTKVKGVRTPKKEDGESLDDYYGRVNEFKKKILSGEKVVFEKFVRVKEGIIQDKDINSVVEVEKLISLEDDKRVWKEKFNALELQDSNPIKIEEKNRW